VLKSAEPSLGRPGPGVCAFSPARRLLTAAAMSKIDFAPYLDMYRK